MELVHAVLALRRETTTVVEARPQPLLHHLDHGLVLPAYDQVLKCSHAFNLLDARGVISVTERGAYIWRVRTLAARVARAWLELTAPVEEAVRA